ncbi:hypothetical protein D3C85_1527040 [compost metagenome]
MRTHGDQALEQALDLQIAIEIFLRKHVPEVAAFVGQGQENRQVLVVVIDGGIAYELGLPKLVTKVAILAQKLREQSFLANLGQGVGHLGDAIKKLS